MEANIINDNFVHDSNYKRIYIKQNMDYEEKYKKTLEKARKELQACGSVDCDAAKQIFRFFPELKESEDERIRKALINGFNKLDKSAVWYNGITNTQILDWLEKQGEQKPTDKVEPKFHEGEWIIFNGLTLFVKEVGKGFYRTYQDNIPDGYYWDIDNVARLWTIQDAKDGDVLEFGDHGRLVVGIVSYVNKTTGKVDVNCLLENNNFKVGNYYNLDTIKPHPATKEQRDLLFQKMKEAGYMWDVEKKELKKVEQKPIDKVEPVFKVGDKIQYLKGHGTIMTIEKIENGEYIFANNMGRTIIESGNKWHLINLVEQKPTDEEMKRLLQTEYEKGRADALAEMQKPAWSEEDEKQLNDIMWIIEAYRKNGFNETHIQIADNSENWLKSIKDRVQPKQEWSEEDEKVIHCLEYTVKHFYEDKDTVKWCCDWLKSLRPQNRWKPSDRDIKLLRELSDGKICPDNYRTRLYKIINNLKFL